MARGAPSRVPAASGISSRPLKLPTVDLAIAVNEAVRESDEWFEERDDIDRLAVALRSADGLADPVHAAARVAFRVAASQADVEATILDLLESRR